MKCPACDYNPTLFMDPYSKENFKPNPGDVGICINCGVKQTIDDSGDLILLSKEREEKLGFGERQILNRMVEIWYEQRRIAS
jgi:hypothetical protein